MSSNFVKNAIFYFIIYGVLFLIVEVAAYKFLKSYQGGDVAIVYDPDLTAADGYEEYLEIRDDVLGWPATNGNKKHGLDEIGARISPAFPDVQSKSCIAVFGDSFTFGDEVEADAAWANVLAQKVNCRINNFGINGYGSDQAFLRYTNFQHDTSKIVILSHLSENIIRNVNQYRDLLFWGGGYAFKPRFILDQKDQLSHVNIPTISSDDYKSFLQNPNKFLPHEYFRLKGDVGIVKFKFPYSFNLVRAFSHIRIQNKFLKMKTGFYKPTYADFYQPDHPSKGLHVTKEILKQFTILAKQRGQTPVLTIIPTSSDLDYFRNTDQWTFQPLLDQLQQEGLAVLNIGEKLMEKHSDKDVCDLFVNCSGHYNEPGNRILADIFQEHLLDLHLIPNRENEKNMSYIKN